MTAVLLGSAGTGVGVALSESEPATVGTTADAADDVSDDGDGHR